MATLHIRHSGGVYDYPENSPVGATLGARVKLKAKVNSASTAEWGLTSNTNASQYCKMSIRHTDNNIYRMARTSNTTYLSGQSPSRNGSSVYSSKTEYATETYKKTTGTKYTSQTYTTGASIMGQINIVRHKESRTSRFDFDQEPGEQHYTRTVTYTATHLQGITRTSSTFTNTAANEVAYIGAVYTSQLQTWFTANYKNTSNGSVGNRTYRTVTWNRKRLASSRGSTYEAGTTTAAQTTNGSSYTRVVSHVQLVTTSYGASLSNNCTNKVITNETKSESWFTTATGGAISNYTYLTRSATIASEPLTVQATRTTGTRISETLYNA